MNHRGSDTVGGVDFLNETHRRYVESGHCSAVLWTKAYCNGKPGHPEPHWSTLMLGDGSTKRDPWPPNAHLLIAPESRT